MMYAICAYPSGCARMCITAYMKLNWFQNWCSVYKLPISLPTSVTKQVSSLLCSDWSLTDHTCCWLEGLGGKGVSACCKIQMRYWGTFSFTDWKIWHLLFSLYLQFSLKMKMGNNKVGANDAVLNLNLSPHKWKSSATKEFNFKQEINVAAQNRLLLQNFTVISWSYRKKLLNLSLEKRQQHSTLF